MPLGQRSGGRDPYARAQAHGGYAQSPQPKVVLSAPSSQPLPGRRTKPGTGKSDPITATKTAILLGRIPEDAALPVAYISKKQEVLGKVEQDLRAKLKRIDGALARLNQPKSVNATAHSLDAALHLMDQVDSDALHTSVIELKSHLQEIKAENNKARVQLKDDLESEIERIRESLTGSEVVGHSESDALQGEIDDCVTVLQQLESSYTTLDGLQSRLGTMSDVEFLTEFKQQEKVAKQALSDCNRLPGSVDLQNRDPATGTLDEQRQQYNSFHQRIQVLEDRLTHLRQGRRRLTEAPPSLQGAGKTRTGARGRTGSSASSATATDKGKGGAHPFGVLGGQKRFGAKSRTPKKKPTPKRGRITRPQYNTLERQFEALRTEFELFKSRNAEHCDTCSQWQGKAQEVKSRLRVLSQYYAAHGAALGDKSGNRDTPTRAASTTALERERTAADIAARLVPVASSGGGDGSFATRPLSASQRSSPLAHIRANDGSDSPQHLTQREGSAGVLAGPGTANTTSSSPSPSSGVGLVTVGDASDHGAIRCTTFNPRDTLSLATGSDDGTVCIWRIPSSAFSMVQQHGLGERSDDDVESCHLLEAFTSHSGAVNDVLFHPNGTILVSVSDDCSFKLWDVVKREESVHYASAFKSPICCAAFDQTGDRLALGSYKDVHVWAFQTWQLLHLIKAHDLNVYCVDFHPTFNAILSCGDDCTVKVWDLSSKQASCVDVDNGHKSWVWKAKFSADGQQIISASQDKTVKVRTWQRDHVEREMTTHRDTIYGLALSAPTATPGATTGTGDNLAISCAQDGTLRLWDWVRGLPRGTVRAHIGAAYSVAVCPPPFSVLASAGGDGQVRVWAYQGTDLPAAPPALPVTSQHADSSDGSGDSDGDAPNSPGGASAEEGEQRQGTGEGEADETGSTRQADDRSGLTAWTVDEHDKRASQEEDHDGNATHTATANPTPAETGSREVDNSRVTGVSPRSSQVSRSASLELSG